MKEGDKVRVTWDDNGKLVGEFVIEQIEFHTDIFIKFTYLTNEGRSSQLVDKRVKNIEIIK